MLIDSRFNGPPDSGNGGYCAGRFATSIAGTGPAEVTLRQPPPLDTPLHLVEGVREQDTPPATEVRDRTGRLIAEVRPVSTVDATVPGVDLATAEDAATRYPGLVAHPFPGCFVCGPKHPDGLRIFPGRLPDGRTAAPFDVPSRVDAATVWAALDCPGGWTVLDADHPHLLGRIAVSIEALPEPGDRCVVVGAPVRAEGRKALVHSTLYDPTGQPLATARATWIAVPSRA